VSIARKYLEPQTREAAGIPDGSTVVSDDAMRELITEYARWVPQTLVLDTTIDLYVR